MVAPGTGSPPGISNVSQLSKYQRDLHCANLLHPGLDKIHPKPPVFLAGQKTTKQELDRFSKQYKTFMAKSIRKQA
jgi:hypothetical protein